MKQLSYFLLFAFIGILSACNNTHHQQAKETAGAMQDAMKNFGPPQVETSATGYSMTATIDGKPWAAKSMMEINASNTDYIQGKNDEIEVAFYIDRDHLVVGKPRPFGEGHSADLSLGNQLFHATGGEWIITKADGQVIAGTFHFLATSSTSGGNAEVTNGSFRVVLKNKK